MFKKIVASILFCFSFCSSASLINLALSSSGHSIIDRATNLEWLKFEKTAGMTVNQAFGIYGSQGWNIASFTQMDDLLSSVAPSYTRQNSWNISIDGIRENDFIVEFTQLFGSHIITPNNAFGDSTFYSSKFYIGAPFIDRQVTNEAFATIGVSSSYDYIIPAHDYCYETDINLPYTCEWVEELVATKPAYISMGDPYPQNMVANSLRGFAFVRTAAVPEPNVTYILAVVLLIALNKRKKPRPM
ncbi:hypothetical protein [Brumicola pallidula]|uniref:PEP-CTERM protein-sorting domain-containing protein n=1 Tax=Brumicola pallidula DSM 14239 = ACAM 615 TaxID=1121922 RepID=K6Y750_9ALTE|nr:hypothetical protein [Glaciecola pallidula]GAC28609.1 hypothetical protein GPAL_1746 [Glaciecola pallidula DSM 14239 = ACAM 615]